MIFETWECFTMAINEGLRMNESHIHNNCIFIYEWAQICNIAFLFVNMSMFNPVKPNYSQPWLYISIYLQASCLRSIFHWSLIIRAHLSSVELFNTFALVLVCYCFVLGLHAAVSGNCSWLSSNNTLAVLRRIIYVAGYVVAT